MSQGSSTSSLNSNPAPLDDSSTAAGTSVFMDVDEEPNCLTSISSASASTTVEPSNNGVANSTKQWSKDVTEDGKFTDFSIDALLRPSPMMERSGLPGNVAQCVPLSLFPGFSYGPPVNPTFTDGTPWYSVSMNEVDRSFESAGTSARGTFWPVLVPMYSQAGSFFPSSSNFQNQNQYPNTFSNGPSKISEQPLDLRSPCKEVENNNFDNEDSASLDHQLLPSSANNNRLSQPSSSPIQNQDQSSLANKERLNELELSIEIGMNENPLGPSDWEVVTPGEKRKLDDKESEISSSKAPCPMSPLKALKRSPSAVSLTASTSSSTESTVSTPEATELTSQPAVQSTCPHPKESEAENPLLQEITAEMLQLARIIEIVSQDLANSKRKR